MNNLTVADVMTTDVLKARAAMPVKQAARVLAGYHVSALPVLDAEDKIVGIVSERDILRKQGNPIPSRPRWWQMRRARETQRRATGDTVGQVMTFGAITIGPEAGLAEAARRMTEHDVKRLPVVDEHGALLGIVSRSDLMKAFLRTDEEIREDVLGEVLAHQLWVDPTTVEVAVKDGIVTLAGTVDQRSVAESAERLVRRLDGVVDVVCELQHRIDDGGLAGRPDRGRVG